MPDNMKSKTKVPTAVLASWTAILDDIAKAAIIGIGVVVWSNGYGEEMKNLAMAGLVLLSFEMLYVSFLIRMHISKRGRLRERAKSYAKALANDILR